MKFAGFFACIVLIANSSANECSDSNFHAEMRDCLQAEIVAITEKLSSTEALLRRQLQLWDEEAYFRDKALNLFNAAVSSFDSDLLNQCDFEASLAAGGNGTADLRLQCQIRLSREYLSNLERLQEFMDQK